MSTAPSLVAALALALPGHLGACPQDATDLVSEVMESARAGAAPSVESLATALHSRPSAIHEWFALLDEMGSGEKSSEDAPAELIETLVRVTHEVPTFALSQLDRTTQEVGSYYAWSTVGLGILERRASASELALACQLADPFDAENSRIYRPIGESLLAVAVAAMDADRRGYQAVETQYGRHHAWISTYLLRSLGSMDTVDALKLLPRLLGAVDRLDATVLQQIGNVASRVPTPLSSSTLFRVRTYLSATGAPERQQAAYAAGRLDDYEAVEALIDLLSDENRAVKTNAHWALQQITAMTINAEPVRWRIWFENETAWWINEAPDLLHDVNYGRTVADVVAAINECGSKRLFRRQLSAELVPMLQHERPMVVRMTCSALASLRATDALPALVEVLERREPEVRDQAWTTLRRLSGKDLPPDPAAWRSALGIPQARPR